MDDPEASIASTSPTSTQAVTTTVGNTGDGEAAGLFDSRCWRQTRSPAATGRSAGSPENGTCRSLWPGLWLPEPQRPGGSRRAGATGRGTGRRWSPGSPERARSPVPALPRRGPESAVRGSASGKALSWTSANSTSRGRTTTNNPRPSAPGAPRLPPPPSVSPSRLITSQHATVRRPRLPSRPSARVTVVSFPPFRVTGCP
jgi:hypothetical protein